MSDSLGCSSNNILSLFFCIGQTGKSILGSGKMVRGMDKEPNTTQMDQGGQENGKMITWMDLELNMQQMEQYWDQATGWEINMWNQNN